MWVGRRGSGLGPPPDSGGDGGARAHAATARPSAHGHAREAQTTLPSAQPSAAATDAQRTSGGRGSIKLNAMPGGKPALLALGLEAATRVELVLVGMGLHLGDHAADVGLLLGLSRCRQVDRRVLGTTAPPGRAAEGEGVEDGHGRGHVRARL